MTELQQKILFYIAKGYEVKEISLKVDRTEYLINWELRLLRIQFKAKNTIELVSKLYCNGVMQQIEKEYL